MNSGSVLPADPVNSTRAQAIFDQVTAISGCSDASDKLACLRAAPYNKFLEAQNSLPSVAGYGGLNLTFLARPDHKYDFFPLSPELAAREGQFVKVPIITGNQEDEGTLFCVYQSNVTSQDQVASYYQSWWPGASESAVQDYVSTYEEPSQGSPFNTGSANQLYPTYKQIAGVLGDYSFSYLASYLQNITVLGTWHGTDLYETYNNLPFLEVSNTVKSHYLNFIYNLDPNLGPSSKVCEPCHLTYWPKYNESSRQMMHLKNGSESIITDDFRSQSYDEFIKYQSVFRQ